MSIQQQSETTGTKSSPSITEEEKHIMDEHKKKRQDAQLHESQYLRLEEGETANCYVEITKTENYKAKRQDGTLGTKFIYHLVDMRLKPPKNRTVELWVSKSEALENFMEEQNTKMVKFVGAKTPNGQGLTFNFQKAD